MSPLKSPEQIQAERHAQFAAQDEVKARLRAHREKGAAFEAEWTAQRNKLLAEARALGLSFRGIAPEIGMSYQGVKFVLDGQAPEDEIPGVRVSKV